MRTCGTCRHPRRGELDLDLARGVPLRSIVAQYGGVSMGALVRHSRHVAAEVAHAATAERVVRADGVLAELADLASIARRVLDDALAAGQSSVVLGAVRETRATLATLAQIAAAAEAAGTADRLTDDEGQLLVAALKAVLPSHPSTCLALADRLDATPGGGDLASALRSLLPDRRALTA